MAYAKSEQLKRVLKPIHLWAIAVGLVISGEYFGWNLGWAVSGTLGLLFATLIITLMFITFIFSYTELTTSIPDAGGAFAYAYRAMGPFGGIIAGYATLVDFLFATPAIALALGAYLNFLNPGIPVLYSAIVFNIIFILINISGVKESAAFTVFITILAVAELVLFLGIVTPHFKAVNFFNHSSGFSSTAILAGLPFAVWLYLGIEGVAMVAEEVENPKKNIRKGYLTGMATLVLLALGVMVVTGGITDWRKLQSLDYPLPEAIKIALGPTNSMVKLFASIGLFGLIASLHAMVLASSRQMYALARSGYLPKFLSDVNYKFKTPHWSMVAGGAISFIAMLLLTTQQIVIFSVLGAVIMYAMSMISLFILRVKEPNLERPFTSPFYPLFPIIASIILFVTTVVIIYEFLKLSAIFLLGLAVTMAIFMIIGKHKEKLISPVKQ